MHKLVQAGPMVSCRLWRKMVGSVSNDFNSKYMWNIPVALKACNWHSGERAGQALEIEVISINIGGEEELRQEKESGWENGGIEGERDMYKGRGGRKTTQK